MLSFEYGRSILSNIYRFVWNTNSLKNSNIVVNITWCLFLLNLDKCYRMLRAKSGLPKLVFEKRNFIRINENSSEFF